MEPFWLEHETNTHQDHVIAHVVGATVLGYFTANETAYLLLDIGFIWIIYLDGEMGLVPQSTAIKELEMDEEAKAQLREDMQQLQNAVEGSEHLKRFTATPAECLITQVSFYAHHPDQRQLVIEGESVNLALETSVATREIRISLI